jgi:protein-tyrosine phosphatase
MKVLMVCLGNICRSPLAHGILEHKINQLNINATVDSAGTNGFHDGELPDPRSIAKANEYGIDITYQTSRQITKSDLDNFDLIYVMDASNYNNVIALCENNSQKEKVRMIMNELEPGKNISVPDPYYGGAEGFENVYQMLDAACDAIITKRLNNK